MHRLEQSGQRTRNGRRWQVAGARASKQACLIRVEQRILILILYRNTLDRARDLVLQANGKVYP